MFVKYTGDPQRGRGCFARDKIFKGELTRCPDAKILEETEVVKLSQRFQDMCYEIDDGHKMCPVDPGHPSAEWFMNHSCDPNMATLPDLLTGITLRDIEPGEELTYDYATTDSRYAAFECCCGAPSCRKVIRPTDWKIPEHQKRYRGYFQQNIQAKIDVLRRCG